MIMMLPITMTVMMRIITSTSNNNSHDDNNIDFPGERIGKYPYISNLFYACLLE